MAPFYREIAEYPYASADLAAYALVRREDQLIRGSLAKLTESIIARFLDDPFENAADDSGARLVSSPPAV